MRIQNYIFVVSLFIIGLTTSCEKPVSNFKLKDHDPKIVLNTILETDSTLKVFGSRSFDLNDSKKLSNEIGNLSISASSDGSSVTLTKVSKNSYELSETFIKENTTYALEASASGYKTVNASVTIPSKPAIAKVDTGLRLTTEPDCFDCPLHFFVEIDVEFADNAGTRDYYQVELLIIYRLEEEDVVQTIILPIQASIVSPFIDFSGNRSYISPSDINAVSSGSIFYFSDQSFNGKTIKLSFLSSINNFQKQKYYYDKNGNNTGETEGFPELSIRLSKISEDLYLHLGALATNFAMGDFPLTEPVYIPSNIENGLGILGAKATTERVIELDDIIRQIENISTYHGY